MTPSHAEVEPMLAFSPAILPCLSATEAEARSVIAQHGAAMMLELPWPANALLEPSGEQAAGREDIEAACGGGVAIWQLGLSPGDSAALRAACDIHRDLEWAGARLRLHVPRLAISTWVATSLPEVALDELTDPLLSVAVETLVALVFDALDTEGASGRVQVSSGSLSDRLLPHAWVLTARHAATGQVAYGLLEADTLGLMLLANVIRRSPRVDNGLRADSLPVFLSAELGDTTLRVDELKALRPQDTVFIDHYRVTPEGDLWVASGGQGLRIRPQADSYCVTQGWTSLMNEIPEFPSEKFEIEHSFDDDPPETDSNSSFDVEAVPVRLTFSVGERHLTLGELRTLQPGETFDLSRPLASGPVIVRANGAFVGTGDLVDIDGRIGVTLRTVGGRQA